MAKNGVMNRQVQYLIKREPEKETNIEIERLEHLQKTEALATEFINRCYVLNDGKIFVNKEALHELMQHLGLELVEVPF